jgi:hypothetical protein
MSLTVPEAQTGLVGPARRHLELSGYLFGEAVMKLNSFLSTALIATVAALSLALRLRMPTRHLPSKPKRPRRRR